MQKTIKAPKGYDRLTRALRILRGEWEYFPVHVALLFLAVGRADSQGRPMTVREAAAAVDSPEPTVSRNLRVLAGGQPGRGGPVAPELLELCAHPSDHRCKLVRLTPRGRSVYAALMTTGLRERESARSTS